MLHRRHVLAMLAAGACAPAAQSHSLYNQWIVYRQKHLLIGAHRKDPGSYDQALNLAETLDHLLPEAKARAARAPHPERLSSLLATRQLELAVLTPDLVGPMRDGAGAFAPYGPIPLTIIADLASHQLVAHQEFLPHHAWLVTAALAGAGYDQLPEGLDAHAGTVAYFNGTPLEEIAPR